MFSTEPLTDRFGIAVHGIDLNEPLDDETVHALVDLLYEHRVLAVRGQKLHPASFRSYCSEFGDPIRHVRSLGRELFMPEEPTILPITNKTPGDGPLAQGAAHWHTDQSYDARPSSTTILYSIEAPKQGGETGFIDMVAAYDALPTTTKDEIEDLVVEHQYGPGIALPEDDVPTASLSTQEQRDASPLVQHRLVRPHPVTGVKALYSPCATSRGIVGMPLEQARELLAQLTAHCLKPEFRYHHPYAVGDVVSWDTSATLHKAALIDRATSPDDSRLLWRISVRGTPPRLAKAAS